MALYADSTNTNIVCVRSNLALTCTICDRVFVAQVKAINNKKLDHLLRHAPIAHGHDLGIADSQESPGSIADHLENLGVEVGDEDDEDDEDEAGARMDGPH